jgi:S1-C subfamily serine protease
LEDQVVAVYDRTSPAVVNITNRRFMMSRFMGTIPQEGTGSGFVYDTEGHIVTNFHVIEGADELVVTLSDGQVFPAELIGSDPLNDLSVIRIDAGENLPRPLPLGDSEQLRVGQFVLAIGNPFGVGQTLTTGVISALGRVIQSPEDDAFIGEAIQTDAAINPGNSGGPMLDLQGSVIGVNSQIVSPSGASAGIGFAVSSATVAQVIPVLIAEGSYPHPWLGADLLPLSPAVSGFLRDAGADVSMDYGLLVLQTDARGPADSAGVRGGNARLRLGPYQLSVGGDVILAIDGRPMRDLQTLSLYLQGETVVGDTVEVTLVRDGDESTVELTLEAQPEA